MSELKTLQEITLEAQNITNLLLEQMGKINEDLEKRLDEVKTNLKTKTDSYAWLLKSLEADEEKFRDRADMFMKIARGLKTFRDRLKDNIKLAMLMLQTDEIKGDDVRFKLSPCAPTLVINEAEIPSEYQIITYSPDKKRIKEELEKDTKIPGASLVPGVSLRTFAVRRDK